MASTTETVYLGRDNSIDLILQANGAVADLSPVTRIDLKIKTTTISSTDPAAGPVKWCQPGYATGEIRLFLGNVAGLTAAKTSVPCYIVVYDPLNPDGIVWGQIPLLIQSGI